MASTSHASLPLSSKLGSSQVRIRGSDGVRVLNLFLVNSLDSIRHCFSPDLSSARGFADYSSYTQPQASSSISLRRHGIRAPSLSCWPGHPGLLHHPTVLHVHSKAEHVRGDVREGSKLFKYGRASVTQNTNYNDKRGSCDTFFATIPYSAHSGFPKDGTSSIIPDQRVQYSSYGICLQSH